MPARSNEPARPDASAEAPLPGGFPAAGLSVARDAILAGGPSRDGIASVDTPRFVAPDEARRWVRDEHVGIGVERDGDARAKTNHLIEHHQIVNDRFGDERVVIAYDPLVDVARAFRAGRVGSGGKGRAGRFGVSGLIHRCNFLLYDRSDESLWTHFDGRSITGEHAGTRLEQLRVRVETLRAWQRRHPGTRVLRPPEPRRIDYRYSRYSTSWVSDDVPFPLDHVDARIHPKELVLGAKIGDRTRVYLATVVERRGGRIVDELEGRRIRVEWDRRAGAFSFEAPEDVEMTSAFWFAWKNFHPDTEMWNVRFEPADEASLAP